MHLTSPIWQAIVLSQFRWEREALDLVWDPLPYQDPYDAWANAGFLEDVGSINEVELLVLSPRGLPSWR